MGINITVVVGEDEMDWNDFNFLQQEINQRVLKECSDYFTHNQIQKLNKIFELRKDYSISYFGNYREEGLSFEDCLDFNVVVKCSAAANIRDRIDAQSTQPEFLFGKLSDGFIGVAVKQHHIFTLVINANPGCPGGIC